jgi:hypothetical protein
MMLNQVLLASIALLAGLAIGFRTASWGAVSRPPAAASPTTSGIFKNYAPVVIQTLQSRGMTGACPMCKKNEWVVHEVPVSLPVYEMDGKVKVPGTSMPVAAMICKNCGFMSFHSLGALGLLNAINTQPATAQP